MKKFKIFTVFLLFTVVYGQFGENLRLNAMLEKLFDLSLDGDECTTKQRERGVCRKGQECPLVIQRFRSGVPFTTCSFAGGNHIVCCPLPTKTSSTPNLSRKRISATSNVFECQFFPPTNLTDQFFVSFQCVIHTTPRKFRMLADS
jgi:hypothetical protein